MDCNSKLGALRSLLWLVAFALLPACWLPAKDHWAYRAPVRPDVPQVRATDWPRNAIDAFILSRLEQEGLSPSAEADRRTVDRRVALALTGLPPTPDEAQAFLDDHSPDAYERLVDRLLASPCYGERMAIDWLDLARYADTHGYHSDSERTMWRWRDGVIDALNAGMPYDQFTREQLAGDLLPDATLSQRIATGFCRNHMLNDENGAIPEEFHAEYVADRVATLGTVWLGQTLACARCHDHKYDPLTQREFYQLYAFFNNVPENGLGGKTGNAPPTIVAPTRLAQAELGKLAARIARLERQLAERARVGDRSQAAWEARVNSEARRLAHPPADAVAHFKLDESEGELATDAANAKSPGRVKGTAARLGGRFGEALLCDGETYVELAPGPKWDRGDRFSISAWVFPTTEGTLAIVAAVDEVQKRRGFELGLNGGKLYFELTHSDNANEMDVVSKSPLKQRRWQHVAVTYDGSSKAAGVRLYVDGVLQTAQVLADSLTGHTLGDQPVRIGRGDEQTFFRGMLDEVQLFSRILSHEEIGTLAGGDPILALLAVPPDKRTKEQATALRKHYLQQHDAAYRVAQEQLTDAQRRERQILQSAPTTMVMQELPQPRPTFVHERGLYDQPGERVSAGTPAFLPPMSAGWPRNRLGLAEWLLEPRHPLTARVAANRAWQTLLGTGLARTPDDFGLRGQPPTHPQLLDWLARDLADGGWDVKRMHRQVVTSSTFRQSSRVTQELLARDPDNRLLARGPRYRLPAETIRDQALAAAGWLDARLGGPSVRPYQPAELWKELAYDPNDYTAQVFVPSRGADLYRRSLYTFWKRTVPPPNLSLLDAPNRETCTAQRGASNTSLQALVLLNDTTFVEAARLLATRVLIESPHDGNSRIDRLFQLVLARPATAREQHLLTKQLEAQRAELARDPAAARKLLAVGDSLTDAGLDPVELAAWTIVAGTVLNLDETLTLR